MRFSLVGFALVLPLSRAWYDTGHMLVAHIAKMQLKPEEVQKVDRLLATWGHAFPGMSEFVSGSVWADHIKCISNETLLCRGLPTTGLNELLCPQTGV